MSERNFKEIFAANLSLFLETLNKILLNGSNYFFQADFETWCGRIAPIGFFLAVLLLANHLKGCSEQFHAGVADERQRVAAGELNAAKVKEQAIADARVDALRVMATQVKACEYADMTYLSHRTGELVCMTKDGVVTTFQSNVQRSHVEVSRSTDDKK